MDKKGHDYLCHIEERSADTRAFRNQRKRNVTDHRKARMEKDSLFSSPLFLPQSDIT